MNATENVTRERIIEETIKHYVNEYNSARCRSKDSTHPQSAEYALRQIIHYRDMLEEMRSGRWVKPGGANSNT